MAREYDPIEEALIQQAATDALDLFNATDGKSVSKFVQSGNTTFHLKLSQITPEQKAAALSAIERGRLRLQKHD